METVRLVVCLKKLPNTTKGLIKCWILFSRALRVKKSKSTTVKLSFGLCGCREDTFSYQHFQIWTFRFVGEDLRK
ncbi:hypothetical protein Peur_008880 [Populus x canadensis]